MFKIHPRLHKLIDFKAINHWSRTYPRLCSTSHSSKLCDAFSDEELMMQSMAEKVKPLVPEMETQCRMNPKLIEDLFEAGLMSIEIPSQYGGSESSFVSCLIAIEELAKVDPSVALLVDVHNTLVVNLIRKLGTEEQKNQWLPQLASRMVGAFCLSEADSGSDAFALRTVAERDGDDYVLSGSKMWISSSKEAGLFLVMASVDLSKKHKGITTFLVPASSPGLTIASPEKKLGLRASSTCQVHLDHVRVPSSTGVLGQIGLGYSYAISMLNEGRIGIGAQMVGLAEGCLSASMDYVRQRKQFGRRIWDFQAIQHQIAEAATKLKAARTLVYHTARAKEAGLDIQKEAAMVKYYTSTIAGEIASRSVEWLGGVGFTADYPVEKFYRDVKIEILPTLRNGRTRSTSDPDEMNEFLLKAFPRNWTSRDTCHHRSNK